MMDDPPIPSVPRLASRKPTPQGSTAYPSTLLDAALQSDTDDGQRTRLYLRDDVLMRRRLECLGRRKTGEAATVLAWWCQAERSAFGYRGLIPREQKLTRGFQCWVGIASTSLVGNAWNNFSNLICSELICLLSAIVL